MCVKKFHKQESLEVGSVGLIKEDNVPRMGWDLGIVTKLHEGHDGIVRSVTLRTKKGPRLRAIQRLHNLELVSDDTHILADEAKVAHSKLGTNVDLVEQEYDGNPMLDRNEQITLCFGRVIKPVKKLNL